MEAIGQFVLGVIFGPIMAIVDMDAQPMAHEVGVFVWGLVVFYASLKVVFGD